MDITERIKGVLNKIGVFLINDNYEIDSLKKITLWYELEKEFDILISDEDYWNVDSTLSGLEVLVKRYLN